MTLIDTSVLLDIVHDHPEWGAWSTARLIERKAAGPLLINDVIWAELSVSFDAPAGLNQAITALEAEVRLIPQDALFLAARAHVSYRRRGGTRTGVLSDFFIGAHALVQGIPLLTRDPRRCREAFPALRLLTP